MGLLNHCAVFVVWAQIGAKMNLVPHITINTTCVHFVAAGKFYFAGTMGFPVCRVCLVLVLLLAHCGKPINELLGLCDCVRECMHAHLVAAHLATLDRGGN